MTQRPPIARLLLLPVLAFLIAVAAQAALKAVGVPSSSALRVFATPAIAAAIVYLGLRPYRTAGRLRMAAMVGVGLLLLGLVL